MAIKLRLLSTAKSFTPEELELINADLIDIETALNSVGATLPSTPVTPSPPSVVINHDQLLGLGDDDHQQYLLLAGRPGGQDIAGDVRIDGQDVVVNNDARLSDARTPTAHKTSHQSGGSDAIKLDDLAAPDDNTDLDASTSTHGLLKKLPGGTTTYLRADGSFATPAGAEAFPIGSVFIAVVSTNPNTLLGYGTWSAFGAGRVLVGLDSGDTDFDTVEETGGAKTVASAGTVGVNDAGTVATVGATPVASDTHSHTYTGSATSVVQPYIVVYMWKRTA